MRTDFSNLYGVFGGAFSPLTNAHLFIAQTVIEELSLEKVIFLPVGDMYGKEGLLPQETRLELIKDCIYNNPKLDVSDVEIKSSKVLTTPDSLKILSKVYPGKELAFIEGYDNLEAIVTWYKHQNLLQNHYIIVASSDFERTNNIIENCDELKKYREHLILLKTPIPSYIRSTKVRQLLKEGKDVKGLVPDQIYDKVKTLKIK